MSAKPDTTDGSLLARARVTWMPMMATALLIVVLTMVGYFGLAYIKGSAFQEERAFRVLGEVARQFDNMQGAMASLLTLVPESLFKTTDCNVEREDRLQYLAKLDLQGLEFTSTADPTASSKATSDVWRDQFRIELDDPKRRFTVRSITTIARPSKGQTGVSCLLEIHGSLQQHLPAFVAQRYFDQVLFAIPTGEVLASVTGRTADRSLIELQPDALANSLVADARTLLLRGADLLDPASVRNFWDTKAEQKAQRSFPAPFLAVAFRQTIGGANYVVSILPVTPTYATRVSNANSKTTGDASDASIATPQPTLYLIGLKRENLGQQVADALGPEGTLAITTVVLLGVLLWPFIGLRFSTPHTAISGFQVFAVIVSLALIPVVLTTCAVWVWSKLKTEIWADRAAEHYAAGIENYLQGELAENVQLLSFYRKLAGSSPTCSMLKRAPIRIEPGRRQIHYARASHNKDDPVCRLFLTYPLAGERTVLKNWSPLRTAVFLAADGSSIEPRITAFGEVPVKQHLNVGNREYVKALREGQGWLAGRNEDSGTRYVAQRLFNRSDAARVLQIAIPSGTERSDLDGFIIGDTRAYGLTASVRPPLLRFAVINRENGQVIFHSDDERSLSENFLVETELNAQLQGVLRTRTSARRISLDDHFDGKYGGEAHRFYYRPLSGTPWGVAVFYPTRVLSNVSLDAAIATLATCIAAVTLIIAALIATIFLGSVRPDRQLLAAIWPQWEWRNHYPRIAVGLTICGGLFITALISRLHAAEWTASAGVAAAGAIVAALLTLVPRIQVPISDPRLYRLFYSWSAVATLGVLVVIPTAVVAVRFQDVSMQTYLRSALVQTAADIEQRSRIMNSDLRRWVPKTPERNSRYPDAATLSRTLPVPGMVATIDPDRDRSTLWMVTALPAMPWIDAAGPPELGSVRRTIWRITTATSPQQRQGTRPSAALGSGSDESDRMMRASVQRIVRTVDGRMLRVLATSDGSHSRRSPLLRTPELDHHEQWSTIELAVALGAVMLLIIVMLASMTARRMFGIYIPFAVRHLPPPPGQAFPFDELLAAELSIDRARAQAGARFTEKDAADIRKVLCEPRYRSLWTGLNADQRQLLHQLATGQYANPENTSVIEQLLYRGYIRLRPWPVITDGGFAEFARIAPELAEFKGDQRLWADEARGSTWNRIRKPLLLLGVLVAVGLMALAGSTLQILSTALAAIAALLGSVTQVTNFVKKDDK
ncbi:hypothetical protein HNQ60_000851 [Povalibacter uvarum]|uniref:Cache domain-containing protein n=1 Tax=Povalibacter uvarum TaxID=732238 RepID=A0A841HIZ1_9GAMM|nr:hypothetical protein [Povalibacter uvarum]MBB6092005.1 hypothetical protein [Povalibacter uvarum]